jgi:hypothetical protein
MRDYENMKADLSNYDIARLPTRVKHALLNSGWNTVLEAITAFRTDYTKAECRFLRIPNTGRKSLNQFLFWAGIIDTGDKSRPIVLTQRERAFIRDCINTHHNKFHRNGPVRETAERMIEKFID